MSPYILAVPTCPGSGGTIDLTYSLHYVYVKDVQNHSQSCHPAPRKKEKWAAPQRYVLH